MTNEIFEKGYKAIRRYFKEIGRYQQFLNITAKTIPCYKKTLKKRFDNFNMSWSCFFSYIWFIGENYEKYNDYGLKNLKNGWFKFMKENYPELL